MHYDSVTMETQVATGKVMLYLKFLQGTTTQRVFFSSVAVKTWLFQKHTEACHFSSILK